MPALKTLDPTATIEEVYAALDQDGFAVVEGLLTREEAAAKRAELTRILESTPTGRNDFEGHDTKRIYALFAKTRAFDELAIHPLVTGVMEKILGSGYQLSSPVGIEIGPGETAQSLHRDDAVYPIARPHQELVCNTMWALDDFTEENGATRVVPGSHRWVQETPGADAPTVLALMPAGSVMFFLGSVFHGGGANNTNHPRLGTILLYAAGWLRQLENQYLSIPLDTVRTLPEPLQDLLGYTTAPPFIGYVDGRSPKRIL
jgi:ectoine hydroxylase-related dioxygenase (phytanoyl-CoA dioxygenase family)